MVDDQDPVRLQEHAQFIDGDFRIWRMLNNPNTDDYVEATGLKGEFPDVSLTDKILSQVAAILKICIDCA
jgi:hypothetical protein